jgi:hypothetical protein
MGNRAGVQDTPKGFLGRSHVCVSAKKWDFDLATGYQPSTDGTKQTRQLNARINWASDQPLGSHPAWGEKLGPAIYT